MKDYKKIRSASGFTLIELLIVIVIIGILAGVLIAVVDPVAQQNKAKDATVRATINKMALAVGAYVSAFGRIPDEVELANQLTNEVVAGTDACTNANAADCNIGISGMTLATGANAGCAANGWNGANTAANTAQCYYHFCGADGADASTACTWAAGTTAFRIFAKSFGAANIFMYRSTDSKMYLCNSTAAAGTCTAMY